MPVKKKHDYKTELEKAAKQMILVRRVDTLIRLILRNIARNLKVKHAALLLYDKNRNEFIANVSRGKDGIKIPQGLTKVKENNPLIKYFSGGKSSRLGKDYLLLNKVNTSLKSTKVQKDKKLKKFFQRLKFQLSLYNAQACVPGFFRDKLVCIFLLGHKLNRKPFTKEELGFLSVLSSDAVMAVQNAWFFQDLNKQLKLNRNLFLQTVMALASAIEAKDKYTMGHTERVSKYSLIIAGQLRRMEKAKVNNWDKLIDDLRTASLLHDIGKIGVPESILNKNGSLTDKEWKEIKKHPLVGFSILEKVDEFGVPILGVKHHHERYDGKGYPDGLKKDEIPLIAQIISIADTYDAMSSDRSYRKQIPREKVLELIKKEKGKQFSSIIVEAFLGACNKGKI